MFHLQLTLFISSPKILYLGHKTKLTFVAKCVKKGGVTHAPNTPRATYIYLYIIIIYNKPTPFHALYTTSVCTVVTFSLCGYFVLDVEGTKPSTMHNHKRDKKRGISTELQHHHPPTLILLYTAYNLVIQNVI